MDEMLVALDPVALRIGHLRLAPGDILVAQPKRVISLEQARKLAESLKAALPEGGRVLILDHEVDLSVLSAADAKRLGEKAA